MKKRVLVVFPTAWDERQLDALPAAVRARYETILDEPRDDDVRWDLDVLAYVDERVARWRGRIDGVFSSSDYPGAVAAAAIAAELGLPGARPESVLRASHKYHARLVQRAVAPAAVPRFRLFDPADERTWPRGDELPCFVKPVKASFSLFARHVADEDALRAFASAPALAEFRAYYVRLFDTLAARYAPGLESARAFLAEEPLDGEQVTVEGWVQHGEAHVLGVVDTSFHPGTRSFARFDFPSALPAPVQARLARIARDAALALGLDHTLFNVELFHHPASERTSIIELNPRLCGQFGDLHEKVGGTNGFALGLALACGESPELGAAGAFAAAASVPLRVFCSTVIERVPSAGRLREVERRHPGTLVWSDYRAGDLLRVGPDVEDGRSVRYGVVNLGGASRSDIEARLAALVTELGFELAPCEGEPSAAHVNAML